MYEYHNNCAEEHTSKIKQQMQDIDTRDVEIRQLKECNVKLQEHAEQLSSDHKTILTTKTTAIEDFGESTAPSTRHS